MKEEICLIYHYHPQLRKINGPSSITEISESSKRRNYNMLALPLACTNQVCNFDVGKFRQFVVDICDLGCELSNVHDAENLRFLKRRIHSQNGSNCKGTRFTRTIFALGYQIVVITFLVNPQNQRNGDGLNVRRS